MCPLDIERNLQRRTPGSSAEKPAVPLGDTFLKQPFAVVQGGKPNLELNVPRSASALGLS